jgi:hypothetical protein
MTEEIGFCVPKVCKILHHIPGASITVFGIAGATGQNRHFCAQINDLLKKWVQVQVKPSKMEGVKFHTARFHQYFVFSCLIRNSTVMGTPDLESTQKGASGGAQIIH